MSVPLIKKPLPRVPVAFAVALLLHLVLLLLLPDLRRAFIDKVAPGASNRNAAADAKPAKTPFGAVIPIHLPEGGLRMESHLGAGGPDRKSAKPLPGPPPAKIGQLEMSVDLNAAAREAEAAYDRMNPLPESTQTLRLVAELQLASGDHGVKIVAAETPHASAEPTSRPRAVSHHREREAPVPEIAQASRPAEPAPRTPPTPLATSSPIVPATPPVAAPAATPAPAPALPPISQPAPIATKPEPQQQLRPPPEPAPAATTELPAETAIRPQIYAPVQSVPTPPPVRPQGYLPIQPYRGPAPDTIAEAPPLPPRGSEESSSPPLTAANALALGAQAAPDRGPGAATGGRGMFFQLLTNQLYTINQRVLSEALRATPKLTVVVGFAIDRQGRVLGAQVLNSTGDPALDRKAIDVIMRASPLPQLAPDMPQQRLELSFPIQIYR